MNITDITIVCPVFRAYRKSITLRETIQRQYDYYTKHHSEKLSPAHHSAVQQTMDKLLQIKSAIRLDSTELKQHTLGEPLLRLPVAAVLSQVFHNLPEPGKAQYTDLEQALVNNMNTAGREARSAKHQSELMWEIAYRAKQNWFMVFNTLTVSPHEYYKVFSEGNTTFADYIRRIDRELARAAYGSVRNAHGKEYHTYCAVVEEGAKNGRLHIHVLHAFSHLPHHAADPNKGLTIPNRRELNAFKSLWPYGFSSPVMVRYSPSDAYGRKGYRWPYDTRTQKALVIKNPLAIAGYMAKYITKSYTSKKRTENLWRIRKSRNLGSNVIRELLSTLTPEQLLATASCPSLNPKLNNKKIPRSLLRREALRQYKNHQSLNKHASSLAAMGAHIAPTLSPLQSLRGSTRKTTMYNLQNLLDTKTQTISDTVAFETWLALSEASAKLNQKYFHKGYAYGTTSNADNLATATVTA